MKSSDLLLRVRDVVVKESRISEAESLEDTQDLWAAGMDSLGGVNLMVQLEEVFEVQFPDVLLTREAFRSISSIAEVLESLLR
jgi:acyl carrier protein